MGTAFDAWFCLGDMLHPAMTETDQTTLMDIIQGRRKGSKNHRYYLYFSRRASVFLDS